MLWVGQKHVCIHSNVVVQKRHHICNKETINDLKDNKKTLNTKVIRFLLSSQFSYMEFSLKCYIKMDSMTSPHKWRQKNRAAITGQCNLQWHWGPDRRWDDDTKITAQQCVWIFTECLNALVWHYHQSGNTAHMRIRATCLHRVSFRQALVCKQQSWIHFQVANKETNKASEGSEKSELWQLKQRLF